MTGLTEKQAAALRACVHPRLASSLMFWAAARASWAGPRKTLGSLERRGLLEYTDPGQWSPTDKGRHELAEYDSTH